MGFLNLMGIASEIISNPANILRPYEKRAIEYVENIELQDNESEIALILKVVEFDKVKKIVAFPVALNNEGDPVRQIAITIKKNDYRQSCPKNYSFT